MKNTKVHQFIIICLALTCFGVTMIAACLRDEAIADAFLGLTAIMTIAAMYWPHSKNNQG
jgi:hypothetical protein